MTPDKREAPTGSGGAPQHNTSGDDATDQSSPFGDAAGIYRDAAWPGVVPAGLRPKKKDPVPKGFTGRDGADPDDAQIERWKRNRSDCNIALRVPRGVVGLDVDCYAGKKGRETWRQMIAAHGVLPSTWESTSRDDGSMIRFYRIPVELELPGQIEHPDGFSDVEVIQHHHRYAIVWPSIHPEGRQYRWLGQSGVPSPDDFPDLPQAHIDHIRKECDCFKSDEFDWSIYVPDTTGENPVEKCRDKWISQIGNGSRHDAALGGVMGLTSLKLWPGATDALDELRQAFYTACGESRKPGELHKEWVRMVDGAEEKTTPIPYEDRRRSTSLIPPPGVDPDTGEIVSRNVTVTWASQITPRAVRWLWEDRVPIGEITLTPGLAGIGKSTFHAWVITQVTLGRLPGLHQGTPKHVLVYATEDSWERSIVPRLIASGANMGRVGRLGVTTTDAGHGRLTLPTDLAGLAQVIEEHRVAMISLDPLLSLVDSNLDYFNNRDVRQALEPIHQLADTHRVAILGNAHFNKASGSSPLLRITGSAAFGEVARAAIGFAYDTDTGLTVVSQIKNNLGRLDLPNLTYQIVEEVIDTEDGPSAVGRIEWGENTARNVGELLAGHGEDRTDRDMARSVILDCLNDQPMGWNDIAKAIKDAGPSEGTGRRARSELQSEGLVDRRQKDRQWFWYRPGREAFYAD